MKSRLLVERLIIVFIILSSEWGLVGWVVYK